MRLAVCNNLVRAIARRSSSLAMRPSTAEDVDKFAQYHPTVLTLKRLIDVGKFSFLVIGGDAAGCGVLGNRMRPWKLLTSGVGGGWGGYLSEVLEIVGLRGAVASVD